MCNKLQAVLLMKPGWWISGVLFNEGRRWKETQRRPDKLPKYAFMTSVTAIRAQCFFFLHSKLFFFSVLFWRILHAGGLTRIVSTEQTTGILILGKVWTTCVSTVLCILLVASSDVTERGTKSCIRGLRPVKSDARGSKRNP